MPHAPHNSQVLGHPERPGGQQTGEEDQHEAKQEEVVSALLRRGAQTLRHCGAGVEYHGAGAVCQGAVWTARSAGAPEQLPVLSAHEVLRGRGAGLIEALGIAGVAGVVTHVFRESELCFRAALRVKQEQGAEREHQDDNVPNCQLLQLKMDTKY